MGVEAVIRPDSWNLPLLVHVLGAMILVGGLLTATAAFASARGDARLLRLGHRSLLAVSIPAWVLMFVGGEWIYRKEQLDDEPIGSAWVLIGFLVAELGGVLLVVTVILGGIGLRRLRTGHGATLMKTATVLSFVLLVAYAVAVWAMAAKPD